MKKRNQIERGVASIGPAGFTLLEVLVALAMVSLVLAAIMQMYTRFSRSYTTQNVSADLQLGVRAAMEYMVKDIRMAGFTQSYSTSDRANFGIQEAQSSKLRFTVDRNPDPVTGQFGTLSQDTDEIITYYRGSNSLERHTNEGTFNQNTQPLLGGNNSDLSVTNLTFTYLDANNNPLMSPNANRPLIRTIIVRLTAQAPAGRAGMIQRTYVSRIRCRNLGL